MARPSVRQQRVDASLEAQKRYVERSGAEMADSHETSRAAFLQVFQAWSRLIAQAIERARLPAVDLLQAAVTRRANHAWMRPAR